MLLLQDCVNVYYSHPWAWDEIGFGGPAYPRAYMRLERGEPEPWEKDEKRYEWSAPGSALSERFTHVAGTAEHRGGPRGARIEAAATDSRFTDTERSAPHMLGPMQRIQTPMRHSPRAKKWITSSSEWEPEAAFCCSVWHARGFASSDSMPVHSGTPSGTG